MEHDVTHLGQQEWSAPRDASRQEQFTAFMADAEPALSRLAWLLTGERHRAEELVQLALARTWAAWPRARAGDPLAYARRVLVNARTDTWRARRREVPLGDHHDHARPGAQATAQPNPAHHHAERDALVRALRALPTRRRRVVVLRYLMDLPEQQVADDLGVSVGTVKSTAARGLTQLRKLLEPPPTPPAAPSPPSEARR